jgi:hypothetical protein
MTRRWFLRGGVGVVVVGGVAAIVTQEAQRRALRPYPLPTALEGQVVARMLRARVAGLMLWLERDGRRPSRYVQSVETDQMGHFSFKGPLEGTFRVLPGVVGKSYIYRAIAPIKLPASKPLTIELIEGAAVSGRIVRNGQSIANATIRLSQVNLHPYSVTPGAETKTDAEGRFRFEHLEENVDFYLVSPPGSLADRSLIVQRLVTTRADATTLEVGDVEVQPGRNLRGRVILSDGKALDAALDVVVVCLVAGESMRQKPDSAGYFEFKGLLEGPVALWFSDRDSAPSTPDRGLSGYHLSSRNESRDPTDTGKLIGRLDHDVSDLTILLEPGRDAPAAGAGRSSSSVFEPGALRERASAAPMRGLPPQSLRGR